MYIHIHQMLLQPIIIRLHAIRHGLFKIKYIYSKYEVYLNQICIIN